MASFVLLFSLLTLSAITTAIDINFTTFSAPSTPPATLQPPPTQLQETPQQQQFNSIIDSIVGAGDFSNWATLLAQADPSIFPLFATFLIPDDAAFLPGNATANAVVDPLLFLYHVVPRRFTFSQLRLFPSGAHLPTLLPGKTLLITNNSAGNFTLNGAPITHSDLFQNNVVSLHGIGRVLDYNLVREDASSPENSSDSVPSPEKSSVSVLSVPSQEFKQQGVGFPKIKASSAVKSKGERALAYLVGVVMLLYVLQDGIGQYEFLCVMLNIILAMIGTYQISRRYY